MNKQILWCTTLLLLTVVLSCNGQKETKKSKVPSTEAKRAETDLPDEDPYFVESETIVSASGPQSITRNILQDKEGNMWFATWEGIMRYDGQSFTNFTNKEGLRRFHVFCLFEDSNGTIWFGTIGAGVYRYDGKKFTNFTTKDGLADDSIGCITEDAKGTIWIGTMGGLSAYNGSSFTNFTIDGGSLNNDINAIVEDQTGKLWIGTRGKATVFDGKTFTMLSNAKDEYFTNVRSILRDSENRMWLGGNSGLWSYNGATFTHFNKNFVGYIYQDSKEQIWTSSADGNNGSHWELTKYDTMAQRNKGATAQQILNEQNMFFGITEDKDGGIWLGTLNGVYRYDGLLFNSFKDNQN